MTWWHTVIVAVLAAAAALGAWLRRRRPLAPAPVPALPPVADVSPQATQALDAAHAEQERHELEVADALAKPTSAERVEALERLMRANRERELHRGGGVTGIVLALSLLAGPAYATDLPEGCSEADATRTVALLSGMPAPFDGVLASPCATALDARCYADREALRVEVAAWTERYAAMQAVAYEAQAAREQAEVREREARRARLTWAGGGVLVGLVAAFAVVAVAR